MGDLTNSEERRARQSRTSKFSRSRYSMYNMGGAKEQAVMYQPTYRIEPKITLNLEKLNKLLRHRVDSLIKFRKIDVYNATTGPKIKRYCTDLAVDINMEIKQQYFDRYRHIAIVDLVERNKQSMMSRLAFLWDVEFDQWINYTHEASTFILNVLVLFVYRD